MRKKTPVIVGAPNVVSGDDIALSPEELEAAENLRLERLEFESDGEAQLAAGKAFLDSRITATDEAAELANSGSLIIDDEGEVSVGPSVVGEGESQDGDPVISYVSQSTERALGEGEVFDSYNTSVPFSIMDAPELPVETVDPEAVYPFTLDASKGRFGEHGTGSRWPLTANCGLEVAEMHTDSPPCRYSVRVYTERNGTRFAYIGPNEATARAYMQRLEDLIAN